VAQEACVQVFREFDINVQESALLSRCSKCNGEFIDRCDQLPQSACNQRSGFMQHQCT